MTERHFRSISCGILCLFFASEVFADTVTNGPAGINATGLGLTGDGISIGQVEQLRPGSFGFDNASNSNFGTTLADLFINSGVTAPTANDSAEIIDSPSESHSTEVAGIMISSDPGAPGVAQDADLYAAGIAVTSAPPFTASDTELGTQLVATADSGQVRSINISFAVPFQGGVADGNTDYTQFIDWSATKHNVLYVVANNNSGGAATIAAPSDNYNGMTVASSKMNGGVFREVSAVNGFNSDADGERTSIDILAPGDTVLTARVGGQAAVARMGSSYATPHVVGVSALLHEYGDAQPPSAQWDSEANEHEVIKAVLMNSADKLIDNGTVMVGGSPVPVGGLLGMDRTVIDTNGDNWLQSEAYPDGFETGDSPFVPLDDQMGVGHLNAARALEQYTPGKYEANGSDVPVIGWDYGTANENTFQKYRFDSELAAGGFLSVTLAWDREVEFAVDNGQTGVFDAGDSFQDYTHALGVPDDDVINDLNIYLMPRNAFNLSQQLASSVANVGTVEHLFFQIPATDEYEIWVEQFDSDVSTTQDYGIAWWGWDGSTEPVTGDYDGNGSVGPEDYMEWRSTYGSTVTPGTGADGNSDGVIDAADYALWRNNFTSPGLPASSQVAVPEPVSLPVVGLFLLAAVRLHRNRGCGCLPG